MTEDEKKKAKATIKKIKDGLRVTKITATRSVKGKYGDSFAGFSAAWSSVQNDYSGPGADLQGTPDEEAEIASQGLTLKEAKVAHYMVARTADIAAIEQAFANGIYSRQFADDMIQKCQKRYNHLIAKTLGESDDDAQSSNN